MSYSKISSITLYVVAVISLAVILFFYAFLQEPSISIELEARVEQLTTEGACCQQSLNPAVAADVDTTEVG